MTDKQVMQMALYALLGYKPYSLTHAKEQGSAIIALREAIAQPEQNTELLPLPRASYYEMGHAYSADQMQAYARAALAAQAGQSEPVARVAASFRGRADVLLCNGDNVLPFGTELYTHPAPVRQPLTDKQDRALCEANCNAESDAFFEARPAQDSVENRRMFNAGHRRAWVNYQIVVKPIAQPEQTSEKDTDIFALCQVAIIAGQVLRDMRAQDLLIEWQTVLEEAIDRIAQPEQTPDLQHVIETLIDHGNGKYKGPVSKAQRDKAIAICGALEHPANERNFCPRCGKRIGGIDDIHTCTPFIHSTDHK